MGKVGPLETIREIDNHYEDGEQVRITYTGNVITSPVSGRKWVRCPPSDGSLSSMGVYLTQADAVERIENLVNNVVYRDANGVIARRMNLGWQFFGESLLRHNSEMKRPLTRVY